jgi:hypothetical protein
LWSVKNLTKSMIQAQKLKVIKSRRKSQLLLKLTIKSQSKRRTSP